MRTLSFAVIALLSTGWSLQLAAQQESPDQSPSAQSSPSAASQSWTGTLYDATCRASTPTAACEVSPTTKSFGLKTSDGKYYRFDATGNSQVEQSMKQSKTSTGAVNATVTGSLSGDEIKVTSVKIS
jgi:hypothetical protein